MGSGRGDRNQWARVLRLPGMGCASMGSGRGDRNQRAMGDPVENETSVSLQWGPVVVTGISRVPLPPRVLHPGFNGVRSW